MLSNYFKIAWRNLVRNKTYTLLILSGLSTGITCAIALWLYVHDELSFDRYHRDAERIYRVNIHIKWSENEYKLGLASAPFAPALQHEYPEILRSLRVKKAAHTFRVGDKALNVKEVICADSTLFSLFEYQFIEGNPAHALSGTNSVVLTEKLAQNLFGSVTGVTGRVVMVKDDLPFTVAGVIQTPPANHHLAFDAILPYANESVSRVKLDKWDGFNTLTYLLLNRPDAAATLESKLPAFYKKYIAPEIGDTDGKKVKFTVSLQPLTDMHLHSSHLMGEENGGNMSYVYTFSVIGLFILLIAVVNYVNLATARSAGRAKEIGVRKVVGSKWSQLVAQFLSESMLMVGLAMLVSTLLLTVLLPFFNDITGKSLSIQWFRPNILALLAAFTILLGLVSGLYPAFVLSRFRPVQVLKGVREKGSSAVRMRQSLVVFQFFISMVLIAGTITVYRQLNFMRNTELGFNQQLVLRLPLQNPVLQKHAAVLKDRLMQDPHVEKATLTNGSIGDVLNNKTTFSFYKNGAEESVSTEYFHVDRDFTDALQISIKAGHDFAGVSDSARAILVNESLLKRLGWKTYRDGMVELDGEKVAVTGVIRDFHLRSLHNQIEPLALILNNDRAENLLLKVSGRDLKATLTGIESAFREVNPDQPYEYDFLDQAFGRQYRADEQKSKIFLAFSGVAIVIACLGLFGLAAFTAEQRKKEIGVRKVLGASMGSILSLLSWDFLKLVLIAAVLAVPAGWFLIGQWLQNFAYKLDPDWQVFALAGFLSVLIAVVTISFQSIRAALANPVESLRAD